MAAVLLHTLDMLGSGSCNGEKVLVEYCLQKKAEEEK